MSDIAFVSGGTVGRASHENSQGWRRSDSHNTGNLDSPSAADVQRWGSMLQRCEPSHPDGIRWSKVDRIRTSIARGDYMTDDRLEAATHRLACDLDATR